MKISIDLNSVCRDYNVTLSQLSSKTGMHLSALCRVNKNKTATLKTIARIATAVGETDISKLVSIK